MLETNIIMNVLQCVYNVIILVLPMNRSLLKMRINRKIEPSDAIYVVDISRIPLEIKFQENCVWQKVKERKSFFIRHTEEN